MRYVIAALLYGMIGLGFAGSNPNVETGGNFGVAIIIWPMAVGVAFSRILYEQEKHP